MAFFPFSISGIGHQTYKIELRLFQAKDIVDDIYTHGDEKGRFDLIPAESWSDLVLSNDMFQLVPSFELLLADVNIQYITHFIGDGQTFIRVIIMDFNNEIKIDEVFVVNDVKLESMSIDGALYIMVASSVRKLWLDQSVTYSSGYTTPKAISTIVDDIFKSAKIDFVEKDKYFKDTNGQICYTAPVNSNIYDNVNYLLKRSLVESPDDGVYTIPYDIIKQKMQFISFNKKIEKYKEGGVIKTQNWIAMQSRSYSQSYKEQAMLEPKTKTYLGGSILSYDLSADNDINKFDYIKREWSKDTKTYDTLVKAFPKKIEDYEDGYKEENIIKPLNDYYKKQGLTFKNERHNWYDMEYADFIAKLFNFTDSIYFRVEGHLDRSPGDLVYLFTALDKPSMLSRFSGVWMISRVSIKMTKQEFHQDIDLIRVNKKIHKDDSDKK